MIGPPVFSFSQLRTFTQCGLRYFYDRIERQFQRSSVSMILGSAVDEGANYGLRKKLDGKTTRFDYNPGERVRDEMIATATDYARNNLRESPVLLSPDEKKRGRAEVYGEAIDWAASMARAHFDHFLPKLRPRAVQRWVAVRLPGLGRDVVGVIDVETVDGHVRDLKTSAKKPPARQVDRSAQLTCYSLLTRAAGRKETLLAEDTLIKRARGRVEPSSSTSPPRNDEDHRALLTRFRAMEDAIEKGVFTPNPEGWWCSLKCCPYFADACPYGARGRKTR